MRLYLVDVTFTNRTSHQRELPARNRLDALDRLVTSLREMPHGRVDVCTVTIAAVGPPYRVGAHASDDEGAV